MSLNRELLIGIVIGVLLYWAFLHFMPSGQSGGGS